MPSVYRSALVPFSAKSMYDLVNRVEHYPQFLPGCSDSKVLSASDNEMKASLLVSKAGVKQWFTTHNVLIPAKEIQMSLVDGPFKSLSGGWTFTELAENACKIELKLNFEFSSRMVEFAFGKVFDQLTSSMVNAFTERARAVY